MKKRNVIKSSYIMAVFTACVAFTIWISAISPALAQETSADFRQGSVNIGYNDATCNGTLEGALRYDSSTGCIHLCDGNNWVGTVACGSLPSACTDDSTVACLLEATRSNDDPEFIADYILDGYNILGVTGSYDPLCTISSLSFTNQNDVAYNTLTTSNITQLTIANGKSCPLSISGDGSPEYQICSDSGCSDVVQTWTSTGTGAVASGIWLQLRLTSDTNPASTFTANLTVGADSSSWDVRTVGDCYGWQASSDLSCGACGNSAAGGGWGNSQAECEAYCMGKSNIKGCRYDPVGVDCWAWTGSCTCSIIAGSYEVAICID